MSWVPVRVSWGGLFLAGLSITWGCSNTPATTTNTEDTGVSPSDVGRDVAVSDTADSGVADTPISGTKTTIRVHYPEGKTLALRGAPAKSTLSWDRGQPMTRKDGVYVYTTDTITADTEWKPLLDDTTWSIGPNYAVKPGDTLDVYPHFTAKNGTFDTTFTWTSATISKRTVRVYLPPTYLENTDATLPVVYMHDGQNLFDAALAFGGNEWKVDETMDEAANTGRFREAIVVGIDNNADRIFDYTPTVDPSEKAGGGADKYLQAIETELIVRIEREFRVQKGRENRVLIGSSLGGLVSSWAGTNMAGTFGNIGAMSPSVWWDSRVLLGQVARSGTPKPLKVYLDSGDSGASSDGAKDTVSLADSYRTLGYVDGTSLLYVLQKGASHSEFYWAQRLPNALTFLLGPR